MKKEIWKDIPGFIGRYQVSNLGRVRSLDQVWTQVAASGTRHLHRKKGVMLRPGSNAQGYPTVVLGRKHGTATVHSLVAKAFLGMPEKGHQCRHKNGNRFDPKLSNLCYGTRFQNLQDSVKHGTFACRYLKRRHLSEKDIKKVQKIYRENRPTYPHLARLFKTTTAVIGRAVRGEYSEFRL